MNPQSHLFINLGHIINGLLKSLVFVNGSILFFLFNKYLLTNQQCPCPPSTQIKSFSSCRYFPTFLLLFLFGHRPSYFTPIILMLNKFVPLLCNYLLINYIKSTTDLTTLLEIHCCISTKLVLHYCLINLLIQ